MRSFILAAAVLGLAACGDGGSNPAAPVAAPSAPRASSIESALPNLYAASITLSQDSVGQPIAIISVCNDGTAPAEASVTRLEYRRYYTSGDEEMYTPALDPASCVDVPSSRLPKATAPHDRYLAKVDEYNDVFESDELDNETWLTPERDCADTLCP